MRIGARAGRPAGAAAAAVALTAALAVALDIVMAIATVRAAAAPSPGVAATLAGAGRAPSIALSDCRLEHPLELASFPARCGRLEVAENPAEPARGSIDLFVAVVPALNRRSHAAPLFVLAGGPGQAASDLYASYAGAFSRVNREHDIVLLDQRGTGRSHRLTCEYPEDWTESGDLATALKAASRTCLEHWGDGVRFYTTSVAVRDLDLARRALGYGAIDLYGSSYGTRVAELYMRRFPQATHAVILDGVTYPEEIIGPETPFDGERALKLVLGRCAASAECAAAFPQLPAELEALTRRFGPERASISLEDPDSGLPAPLPFGRSMLSTSLRLLSYNSAGASLLPELIHEAAANRLAPLAAQTVMMSRQIRDQLASGMQNSVICSEDEPFFPPLDRTRLAATYQGSEQLDALEAICSVWPRGPVDADLHAPLASSVPTLLLSGEADPVTPPAAAARLAHELTRQRHLVVRGEGHGQLATGCVPLLMARFLSSASPESLDASCLDAHHPAAFFVSSIGPAP